MRQQSRTRAIPAAFPGTSQVATSAAWPQSPTAGQGPTAGRAPFAVARLGRYATTRCRIQQGCYTV